MSKKAIWRYVDARTCQVGRMVCVVCGKPINSGRYRFSEEKTACQHRACSENDPQWSFIDALIEAQRKDVVAEIAACKAHQTRWKTNGLDDDIEALERWLEANEHLFPTSQGEQSHD